VTKIDRSEHKITSRKALTMTVGFGALVAGLASPVVAQEAVEEDDSRTLQTITVTATKREQTLQDVPVAVSVVGNETIEKAEIQDLGDLQSIVPSLRVGQLQSSANTNFIIRGFGNGANNAGIEPSVGVFIDGVYRSRSAAQIADLPNLQRVEVLRGPQSTLFGKNASAGVISVVTRAPQFEQSGSIEGSVGNFNAYRLKGDITGPLSDTVAYSLSGNYNSRDGYADDLATGTDVNQRNRYGLRGQLLWEASEDLSFRVIGDYDKIDEVCCVAANVVNGPTGAAIFGVGGALDPENPFSYEVFNNFDSENDIDNGGLSVQADYELDFGTLTSITAYRVSDLVQNADSDFTSADIVGRNFNETNIDTFTQEVRLTSSGGDRFDWMIGGFYFDEQVEIANEFFYGADGRSYLDLITGGNLAVVEGIIGAPVGSTFAQEGQGLTEEFGQDNTAWSIFGTLDFYVTDRLTATVGLNYTSDEKDAFGRIDSTESFSALDLVAVGNQVIFQQAFATTLADFGIDATDPAQVAAFAQANPTGFAQVQAGSQAFADANATNPDVNPLLALQPVQFLPPFLNFPNAVEDGQSSDEELTYTLRLAYDVNEDINVYASAATGFKATSWNLSRDSRPFESDFIAGSPVTNPPASPIRTAGLAVPNLTSGTRFAGPEEATVYEIGLKAQYDTLAFNIALFDQSIEGFQTNVFTGTGFGLANAGKQSTQGIELDATWSPYEPLTISFATTLLDATYDDFQNSTAGDISGEEPAGIPDQSFSTAVNYDFTLNGWDSFVRADWQYESPTNAFDDPSDQALSRDLQREINLWNASFGFVTDSGLGVTFWGRNLFEDEFITTAFPSVAQDGSISGYPNQPRTYGVTVRKTF